MEMAGRDEESEQQGQSREEKFAATMESADDGRSQTGDDGRNGCRHGRDGTNHGNSEVWRSEWML